MDLNTVTDVRRVNGDESLDWREGDGWLAGGTWLFSEPQPHLRRLLDLRDMYPAPLALDERGMTISPTCTIAELYALQTPPEWTAAPLITQCCESFLASFKVWNVATVGGNICMSLPAGPMISLSVALDGVYTIRSSTGVERRVPAHEFVTGNHQNVLEPGDLLHSIELPAAALAKRTAYRKMSLMRLGRSTALLIGTRQVNDFSLTVTAATTHPIKLDFDTVPDAHALRDRLNEAIPDPLYHDDVHGTPEYRKHLTHYFAEGIREELGGGR